MHAHPSSRSAGRPPGRSMALTWASAVVPGLAHWVAGRRRAAVVIFSLALALLIVSFFAKIPQGVRWALYVLIATIVQIALGVLSHLWAGIGALHGAAALVLFGVAVMAVMRSRKPAAVEEPVTAEVA